jgi:hypothetical protein
VIGKLKNLIEKLVKISENIFRVSDASGKLEITKKSQGGLNTADLDSKDAFIVDAVSGGLFVWIGKECTMNERKKAMEWGQEYLKKQASKIKINFRISKHFLILETFTKYPNCPRFGRRRTRIFDTMVHQLECKEKTSGFQTEALSMFE